MEFAQFWATLDFDVGSAVEYCLSGMHSPLEVARVDGVEICVGKSMRKYLGLSHTLVRQRSIEMALGFTLHVSVSFAMTNQDDSAPVRVWASPEDVRLRQRAQQRIIHAS